MPNLVNQLVSSEYGQLFGQAEGLVIAAATGLTVQETEELRVRLDQGGARLRMVRNSLARRALAELGHEFPAETFVGNVFIAYGSTEAAIHASKVLTSPEVKKLGKVALRGGVLDSSQLSAADALALADVPDKQTLRGMLLGVIQGPARSLATLIDALPCSMARVLQARVDAQPAAPSPEGGEAEAAAG